MLNMKYYVAKVHYWYNFSASSFAFKMVSEDIMGSLLDACYQSKEIPS